MHKPELLAPALHTAMLAMRRHASVRAVVLDKGHTVPSKSGHGDKEHHLICDGMWTSASIAGGSTAVLSKWPAPCKMFSCVHHAAVLF